MTFNCMPERGPVDLVDNNTSNPFWDVTVISQTIKAAGPHVKVKQGKAIPQVQSQDALPLL